MRVANTLTLEAIAREKLTNLDPAGLHICTQNMLHNDTEVRSWWSVKVKGMEDPIELVITCPLKLWNEIPFHETNSN